MKTFELKLGDKVKYLSIDNYKPEITQVELGVINHIHILDRSGSMSYHIDDLIEDVKKTLKVINEDDYVTIMWFSGVNECRTVVKNAKNSDSNINKILDTLKSTIGLTCFSEPLVELENIINESLTLCDVFNVTIFTDGDTVTPWSQSEEKSRIFKALSKIQDKILSFNAIGYGNYYNRELLREMASTTEFGQVSHASKIEDYSRLFEHNKEIVENARGKRVTLNFDGSEIVTVSPKSTKFFIDKATLRLNNTKNLYGVFSDKTNESVSTTLTLEAKKVLQAYAYHKYYENKIREAKQVLNFLGERDWLNKLTNVFTLQEKGKFQEEFLQYVLSDNNSGDMSLSNTLTGDSKAYCVLDLLQDLITDEAKYFPSKNYNRTTKKVVDEFNLFKANDMTDGVDLVNLTLNQEKLNISILFKLNGVIKLNPVQANKVNLPNEYPAHIWRTHTIIKDGNLNMQTLTVQLKELTSKYKPYVIESVGDKHTFDLTKLPVINYSYLETLTEEYLLFNELSQLKYEAYNKILNSKLKEFEKPFTYDDKQPLTDEQLEILKEHGLTADGTYRPISSSTEKGTDLIEVREFKTYIKGASALPTITKVEESIKSNKTLSLTESYMKAGLDMYKNLNDEYSLRSAKNLVSSALRELRFEMSGYKMALILTNEWLPRLTVAKDDTYEFTHDDQTLIVKLTRKQELI